MKKFLLLLAPFLLAGCGLFGTSKEIKLIPFLQKDKYGYFDLEGKIVINPQFASASVFRDGLALVRTSGEDGKYGFIDQDGKFVINAIYKSATVFQEDIAWAVSENSAPSAIGKNGETLFTLKDAETVHLFSEGFAAFSKADTTALYGFVDKSGKQVINPQFENVGRFSDGKCAVKNKEGKWGFIDKSGKIVINYQFDDVQHFKDGKAIVYLDKKAGVIDRDGKYLINPQFDGAEIDGDNILINQDDKMGWCDKKGKFIINPQFEEASVFGESELACVNSGDKYGYIDKDGKIMINPQFDQATAFISDIAVVKTGDKYGLIDEKGKYVVNPQFDDIGLDFFYYLIDESDYDGVRSDYLDVEPLLKVINTSAPESLSFNDTFEAILRKVNKTADDFSAYDDTHKIFENKKINDNADYSFGVMGKLKEYDYNYGYYVTSEKPTGFIYIFTLKGTAANKAEAVQKAFEKKLKSYTFVKKGFIKGDYTSVYKSDDNIVITGSGGTSNPMIYILRKDFDIAFYLAKITDDRKQAEVPEEEEYPVPDTTAVAVDTAMVETPAYDY